MHDRMTEWISSAHLLALNDELQKSIPAASLNIMCFVMVISLRNKYYAVLIRKFGNLLRYSSCLAGDKPITRDHKSWQG